MKQEINPQIRREDVHNLFKYLPSKIVLNILSRLPTRTIVSCKCVCKAWRHLLATREFVKSRLSKSVPGLAVYVWGESLKQYKIVEFVDEHRLNIVLSFDIPFISGHNIEIEHSSANGLLFVCNRNEINPDDLFVCNPITREYISLPSPPEACHRPKYYERDIYGFGVSGQYKVVRINGVTGVCQAYTIGTGSWRRIAFDDRLSCKKDTVGAFLNGNLHWLAYNEAALPQICCFDLETELFSSFSPPPRYESCNHRILSILGDHLCVCDTTVKASGGLYEITMWLMKEYGDEKSWTKEFHIHVGYYDDFHYHYPIKVFEGGDILLQRGSSTLLYYSKKHDRCETIRKVDLFKRDRSCATIYSPSFLRLKTFAMENVTSF